MLYDIPEIDRDYKYNRAKFNETIASIIMWETFNNKYFYFGELYHILIFHGFNVIQCLSDNTNGVVIGEKVFDSKFLWRDRINGDYDSPDRWEIQKTKRNRRWKWCWFVKEKFVDYKF